MAQRFYILQYICIYLRFVTVGDDVKNLITQKIHTYLLFFPFVFFFSFPLNNWICLTNVLLFFFFGLIERGWNMQIGSVELPSICLFVLWQIWPMPLTMCALNSIHVYILYNLRFGTKSCTLLKERKIERKKKK